MNLKGNDLHELFRREGIDEEDLELMIANMEVRRMFEQMIEGWFIEYTHDYNIFIKALLLVKIYRQLETVHQDRSG